MVLQDLAQRSPLISETGRVKAERALLYRGTTYNRSCYDILSHS